MKSAGIIKFDTGKIVLHPKNRVAGSASYASGPHIIEQNLTNEEIAIKLLETLEHSVDNAPKPIDWKIMQKKHLKAMGIKTMKMLHDGSRYVSVYTKDGDYHILPFINKGSREGFIGTKDHLVIPLDSSVDELAKALEEAFAKSS